MEWRIRESSHGGFVAERGMKNEGGVLAPSGIDCTGQRFTNWVKFFQRLGHWMAYHSVSVDI